ncbi:hypothetical protein VTJ49DRAFT_4596 [Mycothermus thermophilus]|uniref:Uncharacterized protein n=1 Tax=Humicola insolens TaxID=85995 RepID=A0ABR3V5W7_HUMIN
MRKFLKNAAKELTQELQNPANYGYYGTTPPPPDRAPSSSLTGLNLRGAFGLSGSSGTSLTSINTILLALIDPTGGMLSNYTHRCPRQHPTPGRTDWYGLAPPHNAYFPHFFLCPDCYAAHVRFTPYASAFVRRDGSGLLPPPNTPIRCDLSRYWVRVAGIVLLAMNPGGMHDITILARVAGLRAQDGPCPNGGVQAEEQELPRVMQPRAWYTVWDVRTGTLPVPDWRVCGECVVMIQTLWPGLAQAWLPAPQTMMPPGGCCCGIVPSDWYDDVRTAEVLKVVGACGMAAAKSGRPDLGQLVDWLRKNPPQPRGTFAGIAAMGGGMGNALFQPPPPNGLCPKNWPSTSLRCHTMQGVWEFTVCEQCYAEVIRPDAERGGMLARYFDGNAAVVHSGFTCQLYSDRMRRVWSEAAASGNVEYLQQKVSERRAKERELQMKRTQAQQKAAQLRQQAQLQESLATTSMSVAANQAANNIMVAGIGGGYQVDANTWVRPSGVPDFSQTTQLNNDAARLKLQAVQVEDEFRYAQDEWHAMNETTTASSSTNGRESVSSTNQSATTPSNNNNDTGGGSNSSSSNSSSEHQPLPINEFGNRRRTRPVEPPVGPTIAEA